MSKAETKLFLYESKKAGVIDDEMLTELLEMVEESESEESLTAIVEAVSELETEETVEESVEEPESIETVLEAVESFLEEAKEKAETEETVEESVEEVDAVAERCKETKLNVYEACKAGYISVEERDDLLAVIESVNK